MPRSGLSSRLKQLRSIKDVDRTAPAAASDRKSESCLKSMGFEACGEFLYRRSEYLDLGSGALAPPVPSGYFLSEAIDPARLVYFDLESTGLSGGAGTVAFLAGFGSHTQKGFLLEQLFLADYPGEREFLEALSAYLGPETPLVSYNGRSFDAHLLLSRGLMHGIRYQYGRHYDLLYVSRRLWRSRIGSCSLGNIEAQVLGLRREEDLPGSEVPERWFTFLRQGDAAGLREVFSHHRQDILSLARLLKLIETILQRPQGVDGIDKRSLGIYLMKRDAGKGEMLLREAFEEGDAQAGALLAIALKRRGNWSEAFDYWIRADALEPRAAVCEELAKYYEHRLRRLEEALLWTRRGLSLLGKEGAGRARREAFARRLSRLEHRTAG